MELKQQLKSWLTSVLPGIAAVLITSTLAFGQSSAEQQTLDINKWISGGRFGSLWSMDFGPVSNKTTRSNLGLTLGHPKNVRGFAFLNPGRAWTLGNRIGAFNPGATTAWTFSPGVAPSHPSAVPAISLIPSTITNDTFTNGAGGGNWNNAGNWSAGLPSSNTNVLITGTGSAADVTQDTSATINNVTLNSGNGWTLDDGQSLTIDGTSISNAGMMTMNSTGDATELVIGSSSVTLSGGGTLTLSNFANNEIFEGASGDTLTNKETIQGAGQIGNGGLKLVNSGTIDANQSAGLNFDVESLTNTGTLEAMAGATLTLPGIAVTNTGGNVTSSGAGSTVVLNGTTINNGTVALAGASVLQMNNASILGGALNNSSTGTIEVSGYNNFLGGTLNNPAGGAIQIGTDSALNLKNGTYTNAGSITLNTTDFLTQLVVDGTNVVLTGGGTVTLGADSDNEIIEAANGDKLTNNNTISGSGGSNTIGNGGLILVNSGTIDANASTSLIINNPAGGGNGGTVTNTGTLEAVGGTLTMASGTLTNFSGNTLTGGTYIVDGTSGKSTMSLSLGSNTGGEIVNNAANILLYGSNANVSFVDANSNQLLSALAANSTAGSVLDIEDGYNFTTAGNFTNKGTLIVGTGSKFVVNGNLTNFSGTTLTGGTYAIGGNFQFNNANIVTNAATINLIDSSAEITNQLGHNALANFAVNAATGTFVLQGAALGNAMHFTTGGNFTNNGTLILAGNTKFTVNGNLTNFNSSTNTLTGGTYELGGGTLQFNGANIVTNAANILLAGGNILNQVGGNGLANFAVNAAQGTFTLWYDSSFTTAGNFTNSGTLTLEPGSTFKVNGNLTNFNSSTHTLTGGTYNLNGTLQFNGANIVTNAANLTLSGGSGQILSQTSANGLANFAVNASTGIFTLAGGQNFTTGGNFTNNGTLAVDSGSIFKVNGILTNFNRPTGTLTGGTYIVGGTLQFGNANIVTNAANLTLTGTSSEIINQAKVNALGNFAVNAPTGTFTLAGGRTFTTAGAFTNNGTLVVGIGSKLSVNGGLTNLAGTATDDGTLALLSSGTLQVSGGSLFGRGSISGPVTSSSAGTVIPGDAPTTTGILKDTGAYTQNSGSLDVAINGTTPGAQYDQFNPTTATLSGTLNITRPTSFVPGIGKTFKIMNFGRGEGEFTTVNGLAINSSEHFTISYQNTDVLLTVVSGAAPKAERKYSNQQLLSLMVKTGYGAEMSATQGWGGAQNSMNQISPVAPASGLSTAPAAPSLFSTAPGGVTGGSTNSHVARVSPAGGTTSRMMVPMAFHVDALSIIRKGPRQALRDLWKRPGSADANSSYISFGVMQ
jgi:hypothetical protein